MLSDSLARAAVSEAISYREKLGTQQWLLYPPLICIYIPLGLLILLWPLIPIISCTGGFAEHRWFYGRWLELTYIPANQELICLALWVCISLAILGLWSAILGAFLLHWPAALRALFRPFANGFNRKSALGIIFTDLALAVLLAVVGVWLIR